MPIIKPSLRRLDVVTNEEQEGKRKKEHEAMPRGVTGESSVESIPFQVLILIGFCFV